MCVYVIFIGRDFQGYEKLFEGTFQGKKFEKHCLTQARWTQSSAQGLQ